MRWPFRQRSRSSRARTTAAPLLALGVLALGVEGLRAQDAPVPTPPSAISDAAAIAPAARDLAIAYAVVTNASVPAIALTLDDLRSVFFFRRKFWSGGNRVTLLLPSSGLDARRVVLEEIYRLSDAGLKRLILEKLFQGEIDGAPRVVDSYQQALAYVAAARGTVTIVRADAIPASQQGVKVLRIDGKLPGEGGYPLTQ